MIAIRLLTIRHFLLRFTLRVSRANYQLTAIRLYNRCSLAPVTCQRRQRRRRRKATEDTRTPEAVLSCSDRCLCEDDHRWLARVCLRLFARACKHTSAHISACHSCGKASNGPILAVLEGIGCSHAMVRSAHSKWQFCWVSACVWVYCHSRLHSFVSVPHYRFTLLIPTVQWRLCQSLCYFKLFPSLPREKEKERNDGHTRRAVCRDVIRVPKHVCFQSGIPQVNWRKFAERINHRLDSIAYLHLNGQFKLYLEHVKLSWRKGKD